MKIIFPDGTDVIEYIEKINRESLEKGEAVIVRGEIIQCKPWMKYFPKIQRRYALKIYKLVKQWEKSFGESEK